LQPDKYSTVTPFAQLQLVVILEGFANISEQARRLPRLLTEVN